MRILIACEESQTVCKAFRAKGHEAYSCDILPCSGGHPEWHIQEDVLNVINGGVFRINDKHGFGDEIIVYKWDMMIGHPPCKYLAFSGEKWRIPGHSCYKKGHFRLRLKALGFLMKLYNAPIEKIAIENSYSDFIHKYFRISDQKVQPWQFGHTTKKETHFWLKNLPPLMSTKIVPESMRTDEIHKMAPGKDRERLRSKTFPGIAEAMADQWG